MTIKFTFNTAKQSTDHLIRWGLLVLVTGIFIILLYPSLTTRHHVYQLGEVAEKNIKATQDFLIEDKLATETRKQEAAAAVLAVYDHDERLVYRISGRVHQAFALLHKVLAAPAASVSQPQATGAPSPPEAPTTEESAKLNKAEFEKILGIQLDENDYTTIARSPSRDDIPNIISRILKEILENGVVANKEILLRQINSGITLRSLQGKTESTVTTLRSFYGLDQAKTMVRIVGDPLLRDYQYNIRNLIVAVTQELITPNITLNRSETEKRRNRAIDAIKPILYQIKTGEMILREGERVTPIQMVKLNAMQSGNKSEEMIVNAIGAALVLMCLLVITYHLFASKQPKSRKIHNKDLLLLVSVLISLFVIAKLSVVVMNTLRHSGALVIPEHTACFGMPIASGALVICLFIGLDYALFTSLLAAVSITILFQNRFDLFLYFFLSSALAAYWIQECRERKLFIKVGAKLGLLNVLLATAIHLFRADLSIMNLVWAWGLAFSAGITTAIISVGVAPLVEMIFGYKTDVTLLELANLDQPILRRLLLESPGTYHHSVVVGSMVEAAAAQIGANPLKARVCGYYHDIGKINKPLYFIENQRSGKNRHDKLAPSMSALILISHIKDGVELAKAHRLGQDIIDVIRQHHGTSLITFFYDKAKQQKGEDAVNIENFRYPGPRPQTREAALVMLADVVEAASRTLENPTPARIQKLVQNLINKVFSDGQLGACELTLRDLHEIAKCFNNILNGIHHHRIEYPESATTAVQAKGKNGSTDRQQTRSDKNVGTAASQDSDGHLKRLGLS